MTRYPPLWQQNGSYAAQLDRMLLNTLWPNGGSIGLGASVVANTMNVSIDLGTAAVTLQTAQNTALCKSDATELVTSPTAPPAGQTRIDVAVLQVRDAAIDSGANNDFYFTVLSGVATTGTPVAPSIPAAAYAIAQWVVPAGVANLNGVALVDRRVPLMTAGGVRQVAFRQVSITQSGYANATPVAIPNATVAVNFIAGHLYRVSFKCLATGTASAQWLNGNVRGMGIGADYVIGTGVASSLPGFGTTLAGDNWIGPGTNVPSPTLGAGTLQLWMNGNGSGTTFGLSGLVTLCVEDFGNY